MPAATLPASTLHHEACDQSYEETTKILFRKHPQRMILEPFELSDIANAIRILGLPSHVCLSHLLHSLFFLSFIFFLPPYKPLPSNHATSPLPLSPMSPIPVSYVPPMVDMVDPPWWTWWTWSTWSTWSTWTVSPVISDRFAQITLALLDQGDEKT